MQRAAKKLITQLQEAGLQKQILPVKDTTSYFQNGAKGVFVAPIRKVTLYYNHFRGDSRGMVDFVHTRLSSFALAHPHVEFCVAPRHGSTPAELQGFYVGGQLRRHVCYRLDAATVERHLAYLCDTNAVGEALLEEAEEKPLPTEWKRSRKTPRGMTENKNDIDIKTSSQTHFDKAHWKHVKATDWKTVGRPADREYPWPVLSGGGVKEHHWSPFKAEETFKP
ncbi:39S ribosomal protein L51, mitochondrial [Podochytrium sp. JEL0797]|nr:39S ribosomal protein L51, mitochondrial [Podochytrium sp. JEL0797]